MGMATNYEIMPDNMSVRVRHEDGRVTVRSFDTEVQAKAWVDDQRWIDARGEEWERKAPGYHRRS